MLHKTNAIIFTKTKRILYNQAVNTLRSLSFACTCHPQPTTKGIPKLIFRFHTAERERDATTDSRCDFAEVQSTVSEPKV